MCTVIIKEKLKQSKKDDRETCLPSTSTHTDTKYIAQHVYTTYRYTYIHTPNKQTNIKRMKDKTQAGKRCLLKTCLINDHYLKYRLDSFIIYTFLSVFCLHVCIHAMYVQCPLRPEHSAVVLGTTVCHLTYLLKWNVSMIISLHHFICQVINFEIVEF